jgi:Major Facilitator Superfamily
MVDNEAQARARPSRAKETRTLAAAGSALILHDGYTDLLYVLLPVWQAEFGLGYAEVGLLRSSCTGAMAALQFPASRLAQRCGPVLLLAAGTFLSAFSFLLAGASAGLASLLSLVPPSCWPWRRGKRARRLGPRPPLRRSSRRPRPTLHRAMASCCYSRLP